ncbi:MAG: SWIM zinc finger family protein [Limnochordales bacterium]|nr:SWIM zinc finger family protein [Limnochordales bacterium]
MSRRVKGTGDRIRVRSRRGDFGTSWWARRWSEMLSGMISRSRLSRGRTYARAGQVVALDVSKGTITARVQGSRVYPYRVTIRVKPLAEDAWRRVAGALAREPRFVAALLAGEIPEEIEGVFADLGLSLLPNRPSDIRTECSCPDWENPCKHVAAVYLLFAEALDRDPFLLFRLRGITRDELLAAVVAGSEREATVQQPASTAAASAKPGTADEPKALQPQASDHVPGEAGQPVASGNGRTEELPADPEVFWRGGRGRGRAEQDALISGEGKDDRASAYYLAGAEPDRWLRQLGSFSFWPGKQPLEEALAPLYARAAALARELDQRQE